MNGVDLWSKVGVDQDIHRNQRNNAMNSFVQRHSSSVIGVLSGFDRLLFRGTLRMLATARGLMGYLWSTQTLLKDFGQWSERLTGQVREQSEQTVRNAGR